MIAIRTRSVAPRRRPFRFHLAGEIVVSDVAAGWLGAFAERRASEPGPPATPPAETGRSEDAGAVFSGEAWLAGETRFATCTVGGGTYRLEVAGSRPFVVGPSGDSIAAEPLSAAPLDDAELQILFGPALLLALARRGTFALHAAAVTTPSGAAAFVGESGAGKSTLARPAGVAWRRLADDILPVAGGAAGIVALPRFPQLKLRRRAQYPPDASVAVPLVAVYALEPGPPRGDARVTPLEPADGALVLVAHTVAARAFGPDLLEQHFAFCTEATDSVRVRRLRVPWRVDALPAVRAAVRADLHDIASVA